MLVGVPYSVKFFLTAESWKWGANAVVIIRALSISAAFFIFVSKNYFTLVLLNLVDSLDSDRMASEEAV